MAANPWGVKSTTQIVTAGTPGLPKTYHGLQIRTQGRVIGRISNWAPNMSRTISQQKELDIDTAGQVVATVAGGQEGYSLSVTRAEVWNEEFEIALGYDSQFINMTMQNRPFDIDEWWYRGDTLYCVDRYRGCWFSDLNPDGYDATGTFEVRLNGTITYTNKLRVQGR